jgi:ATP-dependent DNA helicase RecQ
MDPYAIVRTAIRSGTVEIVPEKPRGLPTSQYAAWRFVHVWAQGPTWSPDHAVLLRQLVRWQPGFLGAIPEAWQASLARAGVSVDASGHASARPYAPAWLDPHVPSSGIDSAPEARLPEEETGAEPYLSSVGYGRWRSHAQKEGAWTALTADRGSTTLISLPTGSGKSLCFQILSRFGAGLTVVVVPTVALAIDQWRSTTEVLSQLPGVNPRYYAANDPTNDAAEVIEAVRSGGTRLIFTSPEACVSGRLRSALDEAARQGRLENLVVDEAHIIETWGIYFRVDFQILALRQKQWFEHSGGRLRTFLFSATFTPGCREVLQRLFKVDGQPWREFISQRLRPELVYYRHHFSGPDAEEVRNRAVTDALWHLPRPAILYTTEVDKAYAFAERLRAEGFDRIGCFTGETGASKRRELLDAWRSDEIDVMVATSAFGLGVDKADVRAVVHACLPENLDRYYQEVGRGGRDGASSLCLLLSTDEDERTARRMAPTLLGEEKIQKRWEAMWETRKAIDPDRHTWRLNTDAKRFGLLGTRTWNENILWNKRLLLQLRRAGKIQLLDLEYEYPGGPEEDPTEWVSVELRFPPTSRTVGVDLAVERAAEQRAAFQGLDQMVAYIRGQKSICRLLSRLYGPETQRVCGGCPECRASGRSAGRAPVLAVPEGVRTTPLQRVVADAPHPERSPRAFDRLVRSVLDLNRARRFLVGEAHLDQVRMRFAHAFGSTALMLYRVDPLSSTAPVFLHPQEASVVFHIDTISQPALQLAQGREIVHLITIGTPYLDVNGRVPLEAEDALFHTTPDEWLLGG